MRLGMASITASETTCNSWKPTRSSRASCKSWNRGKERERVVMLRWLLIVCTLLLLIFWWLMTQVVGLPGLPLPALGSLASSAQQQPYSVLGPPTVSAAFINQVLAAYHSPAAGLGQALYDNGVRTGIDPVYALAFFMHESAFGTTGEARKTLALE